jgi:hypothetical protein
MPEHRRILIIFLLITTSWQEIYAQTDDSLSIEEELALLESEMDSLALFNLFDSILNAPALSSEIGIRMGYASSRLSAGRDFNTQQQGYTPGITYYHRTGLYLDGAAYLDANDHRYNQGIIHLGYMWSPSSRWIINPYVERIIPHSSNDDISNAATGLGISHQFGWLEVGMDYAALWDNGKASHRLIPNVNKNISLGDWGLIKNISLYPGIAIMMGNSAIFNYRFSDTQVEDFLLRVINLTNNDIAQLITEGIIDREQGRRLLFSRNYLDRLPPEDRRAILQNINPLEEQEGFFILSYNLNLPLMFQAGKTSFMVGYSYAIPVSLPGENVTLDPSGFVSFSINQRITWK